LLRELDPAAKLAGPSSAYWPEMGEAIPFNDALLAAGAGASLDILTWHYYPQQSQRCPIANRRAQPGGLLAPERLDDLGRWLATTADLQRQHLAQKPLWLGETGNAQCGGQPGISDRFEGGFWWLDELGQAARAGQQVVIRQTLSGGNYGL